MIVPDYAPYTLYGNLVDTATLSASSQALPVSRLQDMRPGRVWRATGCANETITVDFGAITGFDALTVVNHNEDANGTIRAELSTDAGFTDLVYDQTKAGLEPDAGLGDDGFGDSLGGTPLDGDPYKSQSLSVFRFGGRLYGRYARFTFVNPDLAAGYIQAGRVGAYLEYQPEDTGAEYGWSWRWNDPSQITDTERSVFTVNRPRYRVMTFKMPAVKQSEAFGPINRMRKVLGKSKDMIVSACPGEYWDANAAQVATIYGLMAEDAGIDNPFFQRFATQITARELVP